jgi:hypothetical protein
MHQRYTPVDLVLIGVCGVLTAITTYHAIGTPTLRVPALVVAGCLTMFLAFPLLERRTRQREHVMFDRITIRRTMRRGGVETITWREVDEIQIVTTDNGPGQDDVFWLLLNRDHTCGCAVGHSAEGFPALLAELQRLPGFDNAVVVQAMGSATNRRFIVWQRATGQPSRAAGQFGFGGHSGKDRGDGDGSEHRGACA